MIKQTFALLIIGLFLAMPAVLSAQQEQADPDQALLPDIDPQDIEIRSQFQARFPGLHRQPILGFNPRSRVFQVDPDRTPFIEDEELVVGSLPIGELDRPEPPVFERLGYAPPRNGFARIGAGSYISPEADLFGITKIGSRNWLSGNLNFESSDGHLDQINSSYRYFDGTVNSYSAIGENSTFRTNFSVRSNFNNLLPIESENEELASAETRISQNGFEGLASFRSARTSLTGIDIYAGGYVNEFSANSDIDFFQGDASEWGFRGGGEYSRLGNNIEEVHRLSIDLEVGNIAPIAENSDYWFNQNISAHYERLFNYQTDVNVTLGVSGVTDAQRDFIIYFSPDIHVSHIISDGFEIRGGVKGSPSHRTLSSIQQENRFIDLQSQVLHQYELEAMAEVEVEPFTGMRFYGGVSHSRINNHLFYTRTQNPGTNSEIEAAYFDLNFADATIFKVHGGLSQELRPDILWVGADAYWQDPQLDDNRTVPFMENIGVKGTVSFRPTRQVFIEGWGEFIGNRELVGADDLSGYFLLGGKFEISLTERAGVYGKLLNLLDNDYEVWQGYPERGFQGFVGFTYLF